MRLYLQRRVTRMSPSHPDNPARAFAAVIWQEYDWTAQWVAERPQCGDGGPGTTLPRMLSGACKVLIDQDPEAFAKRVRDTRYMLAMQRVNPAEQ